MSALEYRTIRKVAKGGSGVVYKAVLSDGRPAAVKRLSARHRDDRLEREALLLASLDHRNIVKFFGVKKGKRDSLDLVMEWVGPSLGRVMESGELPTGMVVHVIREVLHALDYLHGAGKQHRDLSPGNVLLGEDGSVKLADLGLCKPTGAPRTTDVLKGTDPYVSPEQQGSGPLDGRCDLFTLGVVFYELLTGRLPFPSSWALRKRPAVTPVCVVRPEVPERIEAVVMRLLEYERDKRFPSAASVLAELGDAPLARELGQADVARLLRERGLVEDGTWIAIARRRVGLPAVAAAVLVGGLLGVGGVSLYGVHGATAQAATSADAESAVLDTPASPVERQVTDTGPSQRAQDPTAVDGRNTGETSPATYQARQAPPRTARAPTVQDPVPETRDQLARGDDEEHPVGRGEMVITENSRAGVQFDLASEEKSPADIVADGDHP